MVRLVIASAGDDVALLRLIQAGARLPGSARKGNRIARNGATERLPRLSAP